ncbi:hypothetical protein GWK08_01410 [Leptobacterium flavescens]|uniref:Uncharacterized protein n=1 Tax=Leptobacterium flavescens TaxID=472055 RepID=A0A6P0UP16_9FLAO|nr:hypothetical protein [Leptobacterium flavescens]NER12086.1 hypothetical protein [Leptobacterium flavescens]
MKTKTNLGILFCVILAISGTVILIHRTNEVGWFREGTEIQEEKNGNKINIEATKSSSEITPEPRRIKTKNQDQLKPAKNKQEKEGVTI